MRFRTYNDDTLSIEDNSQPYEDFTQSTDIAAGPSKPSKYFSKNQELENNRFWLLHYNVSPRKSYDYHNFNNPTTNGHFKYRPVTREAASIVKRLSYLSLSPEITRNDVNYLETEDSTYSSPPIDILDLDYDELCKIASQENRGESQEDPRDYNIGGYKPVRLNEEINDNYIVIRKLGYGQFSTVWLCLNKKSDSYNAIKISKANDKLYEVSFEEIKMFQVVGQKNLFHIGYKNIVQMIDHFTCISENGLHTAIVLEVMGPSLLHLLRLSKFRGIEIKGVKRIVTQILQGLMYLHDECKIIHTDIKPENILIKAKDSFIMKMVNTTKRFTELGIPQPKTYVGSDCWEEVQNIQDQVTSSSLSERGDSKPESPLSKLKRPLLIESTIEIKIGDMGNACFQHRKYNASTIQTRQYRALEVIIGGEWNFSSDIWSVGCTAYEMATGEYLFYPNPYNGISLDMHHLKLIWETLNGIPKYIALKGKKSSYFFNRNGDLRLLSSNSLKICIIEDLLVEKFNWKRSNAIQFATFTNYLIEPDQRLRYSASEALQSTWLNEDI